MNFLPSSTVNSGASLLQVGKRCLRWECFPHLGSLFYKREEISKSYLQVTFKSSLTANLLKIKGIVTIGRSWPGLWQVQVLFEIMILKEQWKRKVRIPIQKTIALSLFQKQEEEKPAGSNGPMKSWSIIIGSLNKSLAKRPLHVCILQPVMLLSKSQ